jgi:hypothetical protein
MHERKGFAYGYRFPFAASRTIHVSTSEPRYPLWVSEWWTVGVVVAAVVVGGLIGAGIAMRNTRRHSDQLMQSMHEAWSDEYRAAVYLEVAVGWRMYLRTLRPLVYPEEGLPPDAPRDLAAVLRSRAQLERFGSTHVQRLHDEALGEAVTFIDILRALPNTPATGDPDIAGGYNSLRIVLRAIGTRVDALERQMNHELNPQTAPVDPVVEITGRARIPRPRPQDAVLQKSV